MTGFRRSRGSGNPLFTSTQNLDPRFRGDDAFVSDRCDAPRLALGQMRHLVFCAPTCWSQILNASTCAEGGNDCVCGKSLIQASYSGRPNSLIASWLSFGAIVSGTFFTAG